MKVRSIRNQNGKENLTGVEDSKLKNSLWQVMQKGVKCNYPECEVDGLVVRAEIGEGNTITDVSCKERIVRDENCMGRNENLEFVREMLTNDDDEGRKRIKEIKSCEITETKSKSDAKLGLSTDMSDTRTLDVRILGRKIVESDKLTCGQKESLKCMLWKYKAQFASKPGLCNLFEYEFEVQGLEPYVRHTRPIPFSVRPAVREQIKQMVADGVLEVSNSSYANPLTIVMKDGRAPRICVDTRKVNKHTLPDRARAPPIQELLQRFHGSKFITSIDLSSAFLQIGLRKESRKYTAFLFESQLYQYTRCAFGFKNSLSAFVRALQLTLGPDIYEYATAYVDDIIVHSPTFELHIKHLDDILDRLTRAGFTINVEKCNFCKTEISFLGHVIKQGVVSPDPRRIEAILRYPAPKNQKQLRQFLGTTNYHNRFIINYADYIAPLLPLLKKGNKWHWSPELQKTFEKLKRKFADSIHLVQPDESLPYKINTDASGRAIGGVLMQTNREGETHIVSTASRVLTETERRFSVTEQELLAIVFALSKFRTYIFGCKVYLRTDNKALSFLSKCALTSNRIARWVMQIQEYDLHIQHIKGTENFLADTISRNPASVGVQNTKEFFKPRSLMVAAVELGVDKGVERKFKELAELQAQDKRVQEIVRIVKQDHADGSKKFMIKDGIVYGKENSSYPYWRPVLPTELEIPVIQYVHATLGHSGTDKCIAQIANTFLVKGLGRKIRKFISQCDTC